MKIDNKGCYRIVICLGSLAIKIARNKRLHGFLYGCYCNARERYSYKYIYKDDVTHSENVCPSYFCSWFGLIQIQRRVKILEWDDCERYDFSKYEIYVGQDIKPQNFGMIDGRVVCVDYH